MGDTPLEREAHGSSLDDSLAQANAAAAEWLAELEDGRTDLEAANAALASVNAHAAELLADLEERTEQLSLTNASLAAANQLSAELVAELQVQREELEWSNANLKQVDEEKNRVLGVAAHDIRNGLGGIRGATEWLHDRLAIGRPDLAEESALILRECDRLLELLERLLGESTDNHRRLTLRLAPLDLADLVVTALGSWRSAAEAKGQRLTSHGFGDRLILEVDGVRLRQVLDNLISNAIKYSPRCKTIRVVLARTREEIQITVEDEGPGLTPADLDSMFHEFTRLSARPTGGETSHGLGLSIVKRIVDQHGGRVWAENRHESKGARFTFSLPVPAQIKGPRRVLVVDDQLLNRRVVERLVQRAGHTVESCGSGAEAIQAVTARHFDLVLMDVSMPDMDGCETVRRIRAAGRDEERLPILALTGHDDPSKTSECLGCGMNGTLKKPLTPNVVEAVLARWLRARPTLDEVAPSTP